ncbi:MAG: hypothetical protein FWD75_09340 [Propionibacteriaceae bacterium]|nr:hypothetical protein [Propionibacteriaceae bacterium]
MKIEVLYPEVCCLYGDKANWLYLQRCLPDAEVIRTALTDTPRFAAEDVDLIYIGSMSEASQELLIDLLWPYRDRLREIMDAGRTTILLTGNALELFGTFIRREDGTRKEGLGLLPLHAVRQAPTRFNSLIMGDADGTTVVGYTSRFSHAYPDADLPGLVTVQMGVGLNPDTRIEGIHSGRLYATYILGPLLIANPDVTKRLLAELGAPDDLPFEAETYRAYEKKLAEMRRPGLALD